jgi:hypothetical protein
LLNILVNYTINKKTGAVKILNNQVVFIDMPVAIAEYEKEYEEPIVVTIDNRSYIVEKQEYEDLIKRQNDLKDFKLVIESETGAVREATAEELENGSVKTIDIKLPKDTDLKEVFYKDGSFIKLDKENTMEVNI